MKTKDARYISVPYRLLPDIKDLLLWVDNGYKSADIWGI